MLLVFGSTKETGMEKVTHGSLDSFAHRVDHAALHALEVC